MTSSPEISSTQTLPTDRIETTQSWGGALSVVDYVYRPSTVAQLREVFALARATGRTVGFRGGGRSYGDAALNAEQVLVDFSRMNRILDWDPDTGVIVIEPGVTIEQLWRFALGDGWWPAVVPGTMYPTFGGCLAMNVHGKNNWKAGTVGDTCLAFTALLPTGEEVVCSREQNADLFHAFIGGFGMFGAFTSITVQLHRVYSGEMHVEEFPAKNLEDVLNELEARKDTNDYLVAWIDGFARGKALGRGDFHVADYLEPGEDPAPAQTLRLEHQDLPETMFGFFPKSILWLFMYPFMNNLGTRFVNLAKVMVGRFKGPQRYRQAFAAFNFLLDYVPNWKKSYGPGGLIQYQCFVPTDSASETFRALIEISQRHRLPTFLGVVKRHRPDNFMFTHAIDGYSLAMDFKVTKRNRARLQAMAAEFDKVVLAAGGRFYFAKDSTLSPESLLASLSEDEVANFVRLKRRCDPDHLLQTNLSRRLLPALGSWLADPSYGGQTNGHQAATTAAIPSGSPAA